MIFMSFICAEGILLDEYLLPLATMLSMFPCVLFVFSCSRPFVVVALLLVNFLLFPFLLPFFYSAFPGVRQFPFMMSMFMRSFCMLMEFLWFKDFVLFMMTPRRFGFTIIRAWFMIVIRPMFLVLVQFCHCFWTLLFIFLDICSTIWLSTCLQSQDK